MDITKIGTGGVGAPATPAAPTPNEVGQPGGGPSFGSVLKDSLAQVNQLQQEADGAIKDLATGGKSTLHDTMLAIEKAELSFRLMMQVRNKIIDAYQEVLRMQV
jgi:flagellar hook-basal body complex protein FliE